MALLSIETSCDETSVAIVDRGEVLSNVVSSQTHLHAEYGGVVPELATREHLRNFGPIAREALRSASVSLSDLKCVAATRGPGLPTALLIGMKCGQALAYTLGIPFYGIHHHEAHLYSPWIRKEAERIYLEAIQPSVSLIVSGGHTLLVFVPVPFEHQVLGGTRDDAAGECFDKVAKLIGLPYPGGPELDRLANEGNPQAYSFPRPLIHEPNYDFSFSGLKTSVRYFLEKHPEALATAIDVKNLCASIQAAIVEVLVQKTVRAATYYHVKYITISGGVSCNTGLRSALGAAAKKAGMELKVAPAQLCTDNAGMVGILAEQYFDKNITATPYDSEIVPGWDLATLHSEAR
ncbi:MAG: tRNA N6-adenosine threonylcarbamoyltransferase [Verrucomicrobiales bacterium]|nr:tRNA N6-adenosine threonylcarbamoyltransferase [Verrucomicrobiales bacterium]